MLALLPEAFMFEDGASLAHAGVTAAGLVRHWPLDKGSTAIVWGAAGAVGLLLVACLADRGVRVIGIASGRRVDAVLAAGAECAVDRIVDDVVQAVQRRTGGRGAAAVFDPVGWSVASLPGFRSNARKKRISPSNRIRTAKFSCCRTSVTLH
jgi:NADPH:quinone reductase